MSQDSNSPFLNNESQDAPVIDLDVYLPTYILIDGGCEALQVDVLNAAAPKLYEALKNLRDSYMSDAPGIAKAVDDADKAIAAARGEAASKTDKGE